MKHSELVYYRGVVISCFSRIETFINFVISQHYLKRSDNDFIFNVLANEQVTFAFRRNIFQHIMGLKDEDDLLKNLRRVNQIRNIFAHQMEFVKEKPWINSNPYFKNPKHPRQKVEEFTAQELYDEFDKKCNKVKEELLKIMVEKGLTLNKDSEQTDDLDENGIVK